MRAILLILILAVVALIAAFATGMLDVTQSRPAEAPDVEISGGKVSATGGQPPAFEVQTGSVQVGTREAEVPVPKVEVKRDKAKVEVPSVEVRRPQEAVGNGN